VTPSASAVRGGARGHEQFDDLLVRGTAVTEDHSREEGGPAEVVDMVDVGVGLPGGSSAGSAAAFAASLAQVATGTDPDGSIVCPAGMNGVVVGHKPSLGLVSRSGVVPISAEQDTAGPVVRNVVDTAITLAVLSGHDAKGAGAAFGLMEAVTRPGGVRGKRIGLWRLPSLGAGVDALMTRTAARRRAAGAQVVEVTPPYQDRLAELEFPGPAERRLPVLPQRAPRPRRADRVQPHAPGRTDLLRRPGTVRAGPDRAAHHGTRATGPCAPR
jgi:Asp-tRNA(Asn)/Glu-tRNA(Gln) amidotransferase A subunit family amidase